MGVASGGRVGLKKTLQVSIAAQPDDTTCGPTCLHAVYSYYDDPVALADVVAETPALEEGGTLAVFLANHALRRGYDATIFTYNLQIFDPTWFSLERHELQARLRARAAAKTEPKMRLAIGAYIEFLDAGGKLRFQDLTRRLIRQHLEREVPILTGVSATFLYRAPRERLDLKQDDVAGDPVGHFVVLSGYDKGKRTVHVADPYPGNPAGSHYYDLAIDRVVCSILLGIVTYDANLLAIRKRQE